MDNNTYFLAFHKIEADDMQKLADKVGEALCANDKQHWSIYSKKQFTISANAYLRNYANKFDKADENREMLEEVRKDFVKANPTLDDDLANVEIQKIYQDKQDEKQFEEALERGFSETSDGLDKTNTSSTDIQLPRIRANENFVAFYPKGVKVFGNEEVQKEVIDTINLASNELSETNKITICPQELDKAEKFYSKDYRVTNLKSLTEDISKFLDNSIEYQSTGEVSFETLKENLKDTKINYFDPLAKSIDAMRTRSDTLWEANLSQAVYSLAIANELTAGVNGLSVASHDGKFFMTDNDTIKKEAGYLFEVGKCEAFKEFGKDKYNYNIRYTMDNVECNFPTLESNLPPQKMEVLLENLNDVMSEKTANIGFCNSPYTHQHWINEANTLFKKEHLQEYTKQEIKENLADSIQQSSEWRKNAKFPLDKLAQYFGDLQETYFSKSNELEETYVSRTNLQWRKLLNQTVLEMAKDGEVNIVTNFNQLNLQKGKLDLNATDAIQKDSPQKYWSIQSSHSVIGTDGKTPMNEFVPVFSINNISYVMPPFRSTMTIKNFQALLLTINKEVDAMIGSEVDKANTFSKNYLLASRANNHFRDYCISLNSEAVYENAKNNPNHSLTVSVDYEALKERIDNNRAIILNRKDTTRKKFGKYFVLSDYREYDNPPDNKRYEYHVSFVMNYLEIKMPPIKSSLPPKKFQDTLNRMNLTIAENLQKNPEKREMMEKAPWDKRIKMTMEIAKDAKASLEAQHKIDMEREEKIKATVKKVEKSTKHVKDIKRGREREDGGMQLTLDL